MDADPEAGGNAVSHSSADSIVQARDIHGGVHLHAGSSVVRSAYLEQVRRIAPENLLDRAAELAELAEWCAEDSAYVWCRRRHGQGSQR